MEWKEACEESEEKEGGCAYLMQYRVGMSRLPLPRSTATHDLLVLLE